jgi:small subunit ribosomal protein S1
MFLRRAGRLGGSHVVRGRTLTGIEPGHPADDTATTEPAADSPPSGSQSAAPSLNPEPEADDGGAARRPFLIGSQRDPAAYRARPKRDWTPVETPVEEKSPAPEAKAVAASPAQPPATKPHAADMPAAPVAEIPSLVAAVIPVVESPAVEPPVAEPPTADQPAPAATGASAEPLIPATVINDPAAEEDATPVLPGRRQKLSAKMEAELDRAMAGMSLDDLMSGVEVGGQQGLLEPESRHRGRVAAVRRDQIFVELSGREQGCLSGREMPELPKPGDTIDVIVQRFNAEEGLYDLALPGASVELGNWDEVREGMMVDVQVTGHNTGGLECETNHIRGFIPVSQISLFRVEDLAQFVGQRFTCLITDANPARKNLVLSRRAVLEREKEETKKAFFESLAPGQVCDGTVRKLMDFGAFVELGSGVDGLLHVSQLSWGRVKHPSDVLQEGQPVRVRIEKIDRETGRIGLSYRDMIENPWTSAAAKYPTRAIVRGKVTRLMEFGAFVELEPGVEGLVHISELSHKRVWRASDVVKEGDEIDVLVLSVDAEAQRISLSIKGLSQPEPSKKEKEEAQEAELPAATGKPARPSNAPLKGGLGKRSGGESLGLNW